MELTELEKDQTEAYLTPFSQLIGDQRTEKTFQDVIAGIIAGESLRTTHIARFSPRSSDS